MPRSSGRRFGVPLPHAPATLLLGALALLAACGEAPTTAIGALAPDAAPVAAVAAAPKPAPGNSLNAKSCQKNGWQGLVTSTGAPFTTEEACVSYAAKGGTLYTAQTITFGALAAKTFGDAGFTVSATASSGLPVTFTASGNCTVTGTTVQLTGAGSCTITASQPGDATWFAATDVARSFAIAKANQTITFGALAGRTFGDAAFAVNATATSGLAVTFAAADNCTISGNTVSITGAGPCTITASQAGDANWNPAANVSQAFAIAKADQTVAFTSANPSPANTGSTYTPTATATSGLPVAITLGAASTGCSLASGVVSFTTAGTCLVNANQAGSTNYNAAPQVQQSITIRIPCIDTDASLRAAAAAGGTYSFCAQGTTVLLTGGAVMVNTTLTLSAVGIGNAVINAQGASGVFTVESGGSLTLNNVTVTGGAASEGGGLRVAGGTVVLNGSSAVRGNTATTIGGGVYIVFGGSVTLNDAATIANNSATQRGAGAYLQGRLSGPTVSLIMTGTSTVSGNSASSNGGGVLINGGTVQMSGSSAITGNESFDNGGGVYFVNGGELALSGSARITGNRAARSGGGIFRIDGMFGTITGVTAMNVVNNTPTNCAGNPVPGCVN